MTFTDNNNNKNNPTITGLHSNFSLVGIDVILRDIGEGVRGIVGPVEVALGQVPLLYDAPGCCTDHDDGFRGRVLVLVEKLSTSSKLF